MSIDELIQTVKNYEGIWDMDREFIIDILDKNKELDIDQPSRDGELLLALIAGKDTRDGADNKIKREFIRKLLFLYSPEVNGTDSDGHSPLSIAVANIDKDIDLINLLLNKGADADNKAGGESPLIWAAMENDLEVAKLLVEKGADVNKTDSRGDSPLSKAIEGSGPELVEFLLRSGADISSQNDLGETPLLTAVNLGRLNMVKLLVDNGAAVNQPGHSGITPLMVAVEDESLEIAEFLLENGADDKSEDCVGETSEACLSKEKTELVSQNMSADVGNESDVSTPETSLLVSQNMSADVGNESDVSTPETSLFSIVKDLNDTSLPSVSS